MTTTMGVNRCSQVGDHMELLQLTRAGDCEQSGNGALALGTPIAEHDLPPLHGRPEGSFGHVVGGCDRLFMHEGEEVGVMHEQRAREVRHLDVRGIDVAFCQREQTLLDRQHLRDQLRAREWGTARAGIATEAMPQPKQLPLQRQGLATEAPGCRRCRQVLRTQEIAPEMRPTELAMGGGIRQVRRQSVAAQDAGKGRAEQVPQGAQGRACLPGRSWRCCAVRKLTRNVPYPQTR